MHAFLVMALRPRADGYRLHRAVYVKPVGRLTKVYMTVIDPLRRFIVYPALIRQTQAAWARAYASRYTAAREGHHEHRDVARHQSHALALSRLWPRVVYYLLHRWIIEYNFSRQDERVMLNQRYAAPEKLSGTDAEVIQWRRLVVTKHYGGRDAEFEYRNPTGWAPDEVPLERISVRYMQEKARTRTR